MRVRFFFFLSLVVPSGNGSILALPEAEPAGHEGLCERAAGHSLVDDVGIDGPTSSSMPKTFVAASFQRHSCTTCFYIFSKF